MAGGRRDAGQGPVRGGGKKAGKNSTNRVKSCNKKSLLVEGDGGPLRALHCRGLRTRLPVGLLDETIRAVVVERPDPEEVEQHLGLDAGYDNATAREVVEGHGYVGHTRYAREDSRPKRRPDRRKTRRRVEGRTLTWLSKCLELLVR